MSQEELVHIERYWAKELSEEELQDFQIRYKTDAAFASRVDLFREGQEAIEVLGQKKLKESFRQQYQRESSPVKKLPTWWMFAAAAVIAFLIAFILWPKEETSSFSPAELYTEYYSFEPLSLERGVNETDSLFLVANTAFNSQNFDQAIPLLQNLLSDSSFVRKDYVWLHLGLSQLALAQADEAFYTLSNISESSSFYMKAQWNKALIHLKRSDIKKAGLILEKLAKESRVYDKRAQEILEALSSINIEK